MTEAEASARSEVGASARHLARVAARLFATRGYDATSVRTLVEAAGVTKPTLYYHFGSKEGLAQALLTVPMTELVAVLRAEVAAPGDPIALLARMFETHFAFCRADPDRARFVYALLFGPQGASLSTELARFTEELPVLVTAAVRRLADEGLIAPERVEACALACRGMIVISTMDYLYGGRELGPEHAQRLVGDLLHGFALSGFVDQGPLP